MMEWLKFIRMQELLESKQCFSKECKKILEIGGKDGYLANILNGWGFDVISIDISPTSEFFNVKKMNGTKLEFSSNSFDIIFTSHVVAHIENKQQFFSEIKRTLKQDGVIIHIVPSNWWVILTSFWHYVLIPKILLSKISKLDDINLEKSHSNEKSKKLRLINLIFLHPLGTDKSFIHEIFSFSKNNWSKKFSKNGFKIINITNGPLSYSGYSILKNKGKKIRKIVSSIFSSSYIFVMKNSN